MSQAIGSAVPRRRSKWRWVLYLLTAPFVLAVLYALAVFVLARIPVNAEFRSVQGGIPVVVIDNGIHVDFVLPIVAGGHDWRQVFDPDATRMGSGSGEIASEIIIGWGHRDFYLISPTWSDLSAKTVARAVLGIGGTVMHVMFANAQFDPANSVVFLLSPSNYQRLIDAIVETTVIDRGGRAVPLSVPGYVDTDAFYEAEGSYSALYTCNNWAISILADAGVRAPVWSPFSGAIMDQIREASSH